MTYLEKIQSLSAKEFAIWYKEKLQKEVNNRIRNYGSKLLKDNELNTKQFEDLLNSEYKPIKREPIANIKDKVLEVMCPYCGCVHKLVGSERESFELGFYKLCKRCNSDITNYKEAS